MMLIRHIVKRIFVALGLSSALIVLTSTIACSQDIHFSQFFTHHCARTALYRQFKGNYRLNALFRQQWRAVTFPIERSHWVVTQHAFGIKGLGLELGLQRPGRR